MLRYVAQRDWMFYAVQTGLKGIIWPCSVVMVIVGIQLLFVAQTAGALEIFYVTFCLWGIAKGTLVMLRDRRAVEMRLRKLIYSHGRIKGLYKGGRYAKTHVA